MIWAHEQRSGHGQDGNHWESEAGMNLTFSLLLRPDFLDASAQFLLNQCIALGVIDYLQKQEGISPQLWLKWPNDFYVGRNKIGGMIFNNAVVGQTLRHCIAGIGININQTIFSDYCPNPSSLAKETGRSYNLLSELESLLACLNTRYAALKMGHLKQIRQDYLDLLFLKGIVAAYKYHDIVISATILGVDEFGRLLLLQTTGEHLCCDMKEIQYIL